MRLPKRITKAWLTRRRACVDQVKLFAEHWPDGCDFMPENVLEASCIGLNVSWLDFLLDKKGYAKRGPERAAIYANWGAERDAVYTKAEWGDDRAAIEAKRNAALAAVYAKRDAEIAAVLIRHLWPDYDDRDEEEK